MLLMFMDSASLQRIHQVVLKKFHSHSFLVGQKQAYRGGFPEDSKETSTGLSKLIIQPKSMLNLTQ